MPDLRPEYAPQGQYNSRLIVRPIPLVRAMRWNERVHRRLPAIQGGMWAVAAIRTVPKRSSTQSDGSSCMIFFPDCLVGVAIVGHPTARLLDCHGETQDSLQVLRVAVIENDRSTSGNKGVCSKLYGTCARVAREMGADNLFTYIHHDEEGVSLRASGWIEEKTFQSLGGDWRRDNRKNPKTVEPGVKRRFCAPWSVMLRER
jgi:hypothetical protein